MLNQSVAKFKDDEKVFYCMFLLDFTLLFNY